MDNKLKRLLAVLCAVILCVQAALISGGASLFCNADNTVITEWQLYSGETPFSKSGSGGLVREIKNAGINIPEYLELEDLSLEVVFEIKDENALNSLSSGRVQLTQDKVDNAVLTWSLVGQALNIGDNTLNLKLSEANYECVNSDRGFTVRKPINYFRIFSTVNAQGGSAVLKSVKIKDSRALGLEFGNEKTADTYLQLSNKLSEVPRTIEAGIKSSFAITNTWTLRAGGDKSNIVGGIKAEDAVTGVTTDADTPGAGKKFIEIKSSGNTFTAFNNDLNIVTGDYEIGDLAVAFWTYSETAGKLFDGGQIRISNQASGEDGKPYLYYYANTVNVEAGWNYIELPLSKFTAVNDFKFSDGINTFRLHGCKNTANIRTQRICDIQLVVLSDSERLLRAGDSKTNIIGGLKASDFTYGMTSAADAPGAGVKYTEFTSDNKTFTAFVNDLGIDLSEYGLENLSLAFWAYSETAGKLFDGGQIRISNKSSGEDNKPNLSYYAANIQVKAGWNYIELPLSSFVLSNNFKLSDGINSFRINGCKNTSNVRMQRLGDFKLIIQKQTEWELRGGGSTANLIGGLKSSDITVGTAGAADEIGAGEKYIQFTSNNKTLTAYTDNLNMSFGKRDIESLALDFWAYSETDGKLFENGQLRLSNASAGEDGKPNLTYSAASVSVKSGWNHIVIPLSKFNVTNDFKLSDGINAFRLHGCKNTSNVRMQRLGGFKIVDLNGAEKPDTVTVTEGINHLNLEFNYMIFSNTNKAGDGGRYALFVTNKGYPSLVYGDKQFTLIRNVFTGEWTDIAAVHEDDGFISFYINGDFVAKSTVKASDIQEPGIIHRIGADASGGQIMKGSIADIRIWKTARTAEEIKNNIVPKTAGTVENGLNEKTSGLLGCWPLLGNIEYVTDKMADISSYGNYAKFKGTRADDWIDYSKPTGLNENYWTVVFVPDMQALTKNDKYNETWLTMSEWISANAAKENIKHIIAGGSYAGSTSDAAYKRALKGFEIFNNDISWSALAGNLDYKKDISERNTSLYQNYFGKDAIASTAASAAYSGSFEDASGVSSTENSYYRFNVNHIKWMILQLEAYPRASVLEWAKSVISEYSDDNVILTTAAYIDGDGNYLNSGEAGYTASDSSVGGNAGADTSSIWNALSGCGNIKMILCSGTGNGKGAIAVKTESNANGDSIPVFMISAAEVDGTYYTYKPLGMLGIMRFSNDGSKMAIQYYSPSLKKSFSPEYGGAADSNRHSIQLDIKSCSHTYADGTSMLVKVNENAATAITNGYTGDMYCPECEELISVGAFVKAATGSFDDNKSNNTDNDGTNDTGKNNSSENGNKSDKAPKTGDSANPAVWLAALIASSAAVYIIGRKRIKNGRR